MKLYLVRHAQPEIKEYKGFPGPSLGETGKFQAEQIAAFLSDKNIGHIFSSDYTRVLETFSPFNILFPHLKPKYEISLREREKEIESHESLVKRVHEWYDQNEEYILSKTTAIFSHCGPINMILEYLDPEKTIFAYPYTCQFGCHTPLGSIWEISIIENRLSGILITF